MPNEDQIDLGQKKTEHPLVFDWLAEAKWAIKKESLDVMMRIVDGEGDTKLAALIRGQRMEDTSRVFVDKGVAVIPVHGPIIPRASMFQEISGATSATSLMADFDAAMQSRDVKSIVFSFDSPGGAVNGVSELADMIFAARGKKRVISYVSGVGASAAYWMMAATEAIYVSKTAEVGSIGVMAAFIDDSVKKEKEGVKRIDFVSSISPNKNLDPNTDKGKLAVQMAVDELASIMVSSIAKYRGVSSDDVNKDYGQGGTFIGERIVAQKMAEGVTTFENLMQQEKTATQQPRKGAVIMSAEDKIKTVAELKAAHPEFVASVEKEAADSAQVKGAKEERERIQAIESLADAAHADLVHKHKFDDGMTKEKMALLIVEHDKIKATAAQEKVDADALALAAKTKGLGVDANANEGADQKSVVAIMRETMKAKRAQRQAPSQRHARLAQV